MLKPSTLKFLKDLKKNNNKAWFDAHRNRYDDARTDFEYFIQLVIDKFGAKDPDIKDLVAKNCLFRINRDIRFSKDKTPYKTNLAATLDRGGKKSIFAGYYFQLEPSKSFVGGGVWQPMPDIVKKIRQEIDYNWDEFKKIVGTGKFRSVYGNLYTGEQVQLSRVPQGFDPDNPASEYLKFKSWIAMADVPDADLTSRNLLKKTVGIFEAMLPLVKFINRAIED